MGITPGTLARFLTLATLAACGSVPNDSDAATGSDAVQAVCRNGVVESAEECDDNNAINGDGCDDQCRADHACIVSHNGGAPATVSSLSLTPTGQFTQVRTLTLGDNDGTVPPSPPAFAAIAACGRHVYLALDQGGGIAQVDVAFDGALTAGPTTPLADVHSLVCDEDRSLLFAFTGATTPAATTVWSYAVAANGSLATADSLPIVFGGGGATLRALLVMLQPASSELWAVGYSSVGVGGSGASTYRIGADAAGVMGIVEGPADIGGADIGYEAAIRPGGGLLAMAGLSGGCTGVWTLSPTNNLPTMADQIVACSGNFSNGQRLAARTASNVFYSATGAGALRVHEVNLAGGTLIDHGSISVGTGELELVTAYGESIVVTIDRATGMVRALAANATGIILTPAQSSNVPAGGARGSLALRCTAG